MQKQGTIQLCYARLIILGSVSTRRGFVVDLSDELKNFRASAIYFRHTELAPARGLTRTLQKSTEHHAFANIAYRSFMEGLVLPRLESLAVMHVGLDDGNEAGVSQDESRHEVCGLIESE